MGERGGEGGERELLSNSYAGNNVNTIMFKMGGFQEARGDCGLGGVRREREKKKLIVFYKGGLVH